MNSTVYTTTSQGRRLAYHYSQGSSPAFLFCSGFRSDMQGSKALALEAYCKESGATYLRFDYAGHGESDGEFEAFTLTDWLEDALHMIDMSHEDKIILIGSSMGAWIALHVALQRSNKVAAFIGVASAPDFTSRLMRKQFNDAQHAALLRDGKVMVASEYGDYAITEALLKSGDALELLHQPIALSCPAYLLHGMQDADVPYEFSLEISSKCASNAVTIHLVKDGDHRLSRTQDLRLLNTICTMAKEDVLS